MWPHSSAVAWACKVWRQHFDITTANEFVDALLFLDQVEFVLVSFIELLKKKKREETEEEDPYTIGPPIEETSNKRKREAEVSWSDSGPPRKWLRIDDGGALLERMAMGPGPSFLSRIINYAMDSVGILSGTATLAVGNKNKKRGYSYFIYFP